MSAKLVQRVLDWLGKYPPALEKAWDVPRSICLPGIAEGLGVSRSALHAPLSKLLNDGLILERRAHVLNAGTRRRKVYHLTIEGRKNSEFRENLTPKGSGILYGDPPESVELKGRSKLLSDVLKIEQPVMIYGLPGIGKSSLLRAIIDHHLDAGSNVRFARMTKFSDAASIISAWGFEYTSIQAIMHEVGDDILVLDELHEVSPRHVKSIHDLCKNFTRIFIASRAPPPFTDGFNLVELPPLELSAAVQLLSDDSLDKREHVSRRLGCHPLALQMYDQEMTLPEQGEDIQAWVEKEVFDNLSLESLKLLDELAAIPLPVPSQNLRQESQVDDLDMHALLRWDGKNIELQHLVRNVRFPHITDDELAMLLQHWQTQGGSIARLVELHLRIICDAQPETYILKHSDELMLLHDAGLAVLVDDAIAIRPTPALYKLATIIAIERGEPEIANEFLDNVDAPDLQLKVQLLENPQAALNRLEEQLPSDTQSKIMLCSRYLDDRLPGEKIQPNVKSLINSISFDDVEPHLRAHLLVAVSVLKHTLAIHEKDFEQSSNIREELARVSTPDDPMIQRLSLRAQIAQVPANIDAMVAMIDKIKSQSGIHHKMLQLALVEKANSFDQEFAKEILDQIKFPDENSINNRTTARRVSALIWTWRSELYETGKIPAIAEAIHMWNRAFCPRAASNLTERLHQML